MAKNENRRWASALALAFSLSACSLDYGLLADKDAEERPTARFTDYSHTLVVRGGRALELHAASAAIYDKQKKTLLTEVVFTEYDPDSGDVLSQGKADSAIFWMDTEDAEFSGSVHLESKRQDAILDGEYLRWDGRAKKLEGRLDRTVVIQRADGSSVSGAGFTADARKRSFSFREGVEGTIVDEDEGAANVPSENAPPPMPADSTRTTTTTTTVPSIQAKKSDGETVPPPPTSEVPPIAQPDGSELQL